jgi:polyhydroxyalkanoate synthesis regulator phasin
MDSSKVINVDSATVNLTNLRVESLATIDRLQTTLNNELKIDIGEIQDRLSKSFRHFLLEKEQEQMPFLQRVMTSHIENMEDEKGFPPRHPVHWFKSKLEFSSTGILQFDFQKDAEAFMESALTHIQTEVEQQLAQKQQSTIEIINRQIQTLQQTLATGIQPVTTPKRIISTEYVNSFVQSDRLILKTVDRFYFVSLGARFNPKQELIYSEVCVRPTGMFSSNKDGDKPSQLKYAISCDRLLDVVNESIDRSVNQIQQQTQSYFSEQLKPQIEKMFAGLVS